MELVKKIQNNHEKCPFCGFSLWRDGEREIEFSSQEIPYFPPEKFVTLTIEVYCSGCEKTWREKYLLTDAVEYDVEHDRISEETIERA